MSAGLDRLEGWRQALDAAGLATDLVEHGDFSPRGGEAGDAALLAREPGFDGVFAANSLMASGALNVRDRRAARCRRSGPGRQFDSDYFARSTPPLTTVEQPSVERQGRRMVDVLLRLILGGTASRR